ncbi:pentatricopeptide repeat-containing At2g21090 [Olea europaea subsp. europaea]|uniref:Pentatricopeptide repeat-containing At2g21090 n=1 Tax=Olea europaea subsp. europaea TaxID=158383 RepID=A0A8S0QCJ2_OLEEU|nr:pentatricopeptide repeat-containing At2g21090 [Olea europaea subsp. europaea]
MPSLSPPPTILAPTFRKIHKTKSSSKGLKYPCVIQNFLDLASQGQIKEAVDFLPHLARKGFRLNSKSIAFLLKQCTKLKSIKEGKWVHLHLKLTGSKHPSTFLSNHMIDMYAKCGDHVKARLVFDKMSTRNLYSWNNMLSGYAKLGMVKPALRLFYKMPERDVVSWNTMVMAYVKSGWFDEALRFYKMLRRLDIGFNEYSFAGVVTVSVKLRELWLAMQVHCEVLIAGFLSNVVLSSSIVDAYAKCGQLGDARKLFDEMVKRDVLAWTTLVSGYTQCGDMKSAREIFDAMPEKNPISWTALISGYAKNGMGLEALKLLTKMIMLGVEPDQFTFSSCLFTCANLISLEHGRQIHSHLTMKGTRPNIVVLSALIIMYSKCGSLEEGKRVFDTVKNKQNVVLWNTMITSLAQHGCGEQAIKMFTDMVNLGVKPGRVTFLVLLNACSHSGLVQEGLSFFDSMASCYDTIPDQEHYACLIDLLGRAGMFDEVMNQLKKMPCQPDDRIWNALLGVCRIDGNIELGKIAAKHLIECEPQSPAAYLLLSSIYAALGRWESAEEVRKLMNERQVNKDQAVSWLEIEQKLHLDYRPIRLHPSKNESYSVLEQLADQNLLSNTRS